MAVKKITSAPPPITPLRGSGGGPIYEIPKPDYDYWRLMPHWTLEEASYLLCGCAPDYRKKLRFGFKLKPEIMQETKRTYDLLYRLYVSGRFDKCPNAPAGDLYVAPNNIVKWAIDNEVNVPVELKGLGQDVGGGKALNTKDRLQKCFRELVVDKKIRFKSYDQLLNYSIMKGILVQQGVSATKAKQYLSPVAKDIHPHLCKPGRKKGS